MILQEPKLILLWNSSEAIAYAEFNDGYSHIIVDDGCWVLVNGGKMSSWIFPEAARHLKWLPENPLDYALFRKSVGMLPVAEAN